MEKKTLDNTSIADAKAKVSDIKVVGNGDAWQLICKASSEAQGWMKSTKAMPIGTGCIVQVTTQQMGIGGTYAVAEAVVWVPNCRILEDPNTNIKSLDVYPQVS